MRAGKYQYVVHIYQSEKTTNEYGEEVEEYEFERTTKAGCDFNSGQRTVSNSEIIFPNQYTLTLHQYINIKDTTHIKFQGKMYRVVEYHNDDTYNDKIVRIEEINS